MSMVKQLLGEKEEDKGVTVTVNVTGEGAEQFVEFMKNLSSTCNMGCSREIGILDPSDEDERAVKWAFDGDGNTRINVS